MPLFTSIATLRRIAFSLALVSALLFNGSAAVPVKVFLLAGQSNMAGYASVSGLPAALAQPQNGIMIFAGGQVSAAMADTWGTLGPNYGYTKGYFGPELTFGRTMADSMPGSRIALIKYAVGATDLAVNWRPPGSGSTVGIYYLSFINEVKTALATLDTQYIPEITGMLWMQGEHDARNISMAEEYEKNLTNFISDVRREFNAPSLPFIIGMIDNQKAWIYNEMVRNAEIAVSHTAADAGIFDTHGLPTNGVHYTRDGMVRLGQLFGQTVLSLLAGRPNSAPFVEAGLDQFLLISSFPLVTYLIGNARDDGRPKYPLAVAWSRVTSPGTIVFHDSTRPVTAVTIEKPGTYTFRLSASDGAVLATDLTTISLFPSNNEADMPSTFDKKPKITENPATLSLTGKQSIKGITLCYSVPRLAHAVPVELRLFNSRGRCVATLARGMSAGGTYNVAWNATGESGKQFSKGTYIACLKAGTTTETIQICRIK